MPQEQYVPVVPDISDASMRTSGENIDDVEQTKDDERKNEKKKEQEVNNSNWNNIIKKTFMYLLIFIIIVLVIILIYQIYKYFNTPEYNSPDIKPQNTGIDKKVSWEDQQKSDIEKNTEKGKKNNQPTTSKAENVLPKEVRDLDNNVLEQFIKKGNNDTKNRDIVDIKNKNSSRLVAHDSMLDNSASIDNVIYSDELKRLEKLTEDSILKKQNNYDNTQLEGVKEEMLGDLLTGIENDRQQSENLKAIEEENRNNVLNILNDDDDDSNSFSDKLIVEDDTVSLMSESGGCDFELTKGKNKGSVCGRKRVNENRCSRHVDK